MHKIDYSTIPDKVLTPKVLNDFEKVRRTLCNSLKNKEVIEKIKILFSEISSISDGVISDVLHETCELLTPEIFMCTDSQLFFSQKQLSEGTGSIGEISSDTFQSLQNLVIPAIIDIFYLVCLHINSGINKQKLKGLLHLNMQFGGASGINTLFGTDKRIISGDDWGKSYQILRENTSIYPQEKVDINTLGKDTKDYIAQTVCPFRYNENRHKFVNDLWDFFEIEIIPLLQDKFKNSQDNYELFFSGNL